MSYRELTNTSVNPPFAIATQGIGVVQSIINSTNYVYLHGSIDNTNFALIESFTTDQIKIITLPPYVKASGSATDHTAAIGGTTKLLLNEDRKP
tara:strand:+ start:1018 stop:1299 length:282 start_codon:yes stop_codon:yes gene_type:complete